MGLNQQDSAPPLLTKYLLAGGFVVAVTLLACGGLGQSAVDVDATVSAGIAATQQAEANLRATIETAIAATQAANQPPQNQPQPTVPVATQPPAQITDPVATPQSNAPDPEQVRAVILNEIEGAVAQDLELLQSLYAPDAVVADHNGTPNDPSDDTTWRGWANIARRYRAFFAGGFDSLNLVELSIQMDGDQATATHKGIILDGTMYPDEGLYVLERINDRWLITQLEFGNQSGYRNLSAEAGSVEPGTQLPKDDGLYELSLGNQHRYEEPWGWDRGDPCEAWATGNFDDTRPNYRGFNIELLLTNNSDTKVPDAWPVSFITANGKSVKACYYGYDGSGPEPDTTNSVTFFTVVEQGDYIEKIIFSLNGQTIQLCLDGKGGSSRC